MGWREWSTCRSRWTTTVCAGLKRPPELIVTCARFLVERVRGSLPEAVQQTQWIEALPNTVDTEKFFPVDRQEAKGRVGARRCRWC